MKYRLKLLDHSFSFNSEWPSPEIQAIANAVVEMLNQNFFHALGESVKTRNHFGNPSWGFLKH